MSIASKEKLSLHKSDKVASIRLVGEPYHHTEADGNIIDCTDILEALAKNTGYTEKLGGIIEDSAENLTPLYRGGYYGIDGKLKKGRSLTYEEAFSLMTFVSMGTNRLVFEHLQKRIPEGMPNDKDTIFYQSIALLSAMSVKEGFVGLSPEEVAGLAAAILEIDTITRIPCSGEVIGIGGMGGDRGYPRSGENSKLFSLSTLGSAILANISHVHKHHSYPNTSKVAGQSAIEAFGARSDQATPEALIALQETGLLMSSCHTTRTIHTLSHRLKGETINHVVGPLAIPIAREVPTTAFIGVNDNIHPETIIEALAILRQKGVQNYANSVAFCGLNSSEVSADLFNKERYYSNPAAKLAVAIDEVAPPPYQTLAAFLVDGADQGTFLISPDDFMDETHLKEIEYHKLLIPNTVDNIMAANESALTGRDIAKAYYLAMTGALALFTKEYAHLEGALNKETRRINREYLRHAYSRVLDVILSGAGYAKLQEYVEATQK